MPFPGTVFIIQGFVNSEVWAPRDADHSNLAQYHCNYVDLLEDNWSEPYSGQYSNFTFTGGKMPMYNEDNLDVFWDANKDQNKPFMFGGAPQNRWFRMITGVREVNSYGDDDESVAVAIAHLGSPFIMPAQL